MRDKAKEIDQRGHASRRDLDALFSKIGTSLVKDFRSLLDKPEAFTDELRAYKKGPQFVHLHKFPNYSGADYLNFKCWYQLENLLKRYTSPEDIMTPQERESLTVAKFFDVQKNVMVARPSSLRANLVLQEARKYVKTVLGVFSEEELCSYVSYGRRANKGISYSQSYLHEKWGVVSGSPEQAAWFDQTYLPSDDLLKIGVRLAYKPPDSSADTLTLTCVPKKHNIDRTILPNTVLGTFRTNGLMAMIDNRLSQAGYHIPTLQQKHGRYAEYGSRTGKLATGDLASASDLPGFCLMCCLIPRPWLRALKLGRIGHVEYSGKTYHLSSFMTMGISFTFPVETLIFLALLKAIQKLTGIRGTVSVYGDDLIYPSDMAPFVKDIFSDLGLKFNKEKSFSTGHFRESCGFDFMYGKAVRPFQPEITGGMVGIHQYRCVLLKCVNGLRRRWKEKEIPSTLHFLYREIANIGGVSYVPPSFADDAGVHLSLLDDELYSNFPRVASLFIHEFGIWFHGIDKPKWDPDRQAIRFSFLHNVLEKHYVEEQYQIAYYWNSLRLGASPLDPHCFQYMDPADAHTLEWESGRKIRCQTGRHPSLRPYVPKKSGRTRIVRQTGFTSAWT